MNKIVLNEVMKGKRSVALGGHVRPDGDCVGSCMGLYLYLKEQFPSVQTDVYLESVPDAYRIIQGTEEVKTTVREDDVYDLLSALTAGTKSVSVFTAIV